MSDPRLVGIAARAFPEADHRAARCLAALERAVAEERRRCADIADNAIRGCITDEEREIATTIRNLILSAAHVRENSQGSETP